MTTNDCRLLIKRSDADGSMDPQIFRTVLMQWIELDPTAVTPLNRLARLAGEYSAPNSEASRLLSREEFRNEEVLKDLRILRQFAGAALLDHRDQRSAF